MYALVKFYDDVYYVCKSNVITVNKGLTKAKYSDNRKYLAAIIAKNDISKVTIDENENNCQTEKQNTNCDTEMMYLPITSNENIGNNRAETEKENCNFEEIGLISHDISKVTIDVNINNCQTRNQNTNCDTEVMYLPITFNENIENNGAETENCDFEETSVISHDISKVTIDENENNCQTEKQNTNCDTEIMYLSITSNENIGNNGAETEKENCNFEEIGLISHDISKVTIDENENNCQTEKQNTNCDTEMMYVPITSNENIGNNGAETEKENCNFEETGLISHDDEYDKDSGSEYVPSEKEDSGNEDSDNELPQSFDNKLSQKQILNLSKSVSSASSFDASKINDLAKFMGHSDKIHKDYYRQPVATTDVVKVSRYLEMVQGNDDSDSSNCSENEVDENSCDKVNSNEITNLHNELNDDANNNQGNSSNEKRKRSTSPYGKTKRIRWSQKEKDTALHAFNTYMESFTLPSLKEIGDVKKKYKVLAKRTSPQIKSWLNNQQRALRKKPINE
ncbi:PREDICTED: suppressor of Mek1-like, partial [Cyphomyrmex costatus]|uniref:suppressor of Mek1-like n=1 Tax=Cyphomyrmex costatus TaxID=456900 RepID=UPI0008521CEE